MSKIRVYLATALDKEIGSTTYYVMDAERFTRILGEDVDGIEEAPAEAKEQTPVYVFGLVQDLIASLE